MGDGSPNVETRHVPRKHTNEDAPRSLGSPELRRRDGGACEPMTSNLEAFLAVHATAEHETRGMAPPG